MDADNSFYVKFIATYAPTFFGCIILVLAMVWITYLDMSEEDTWFHGFAFCIDQIGYIPLPYFWEIFDGSSSRKWTKL